MNFLAELLAKIGGSAATSGTQGCVFLFLDEPKIPESLIQK